MNGRLQAGAAAPDEGERTELLARGTGFVVEQILSGRLAAAQDYEQDHDEWVVILEGGGVLELDGVAHDLGVERLVVAPLPVRRTGWCAPSRGTSWLVVRSTS